MKVIRVFESSIGSRESVERRTLKKRNFSSWCIRVEIYSSRRVSVM